MLKRVSLLNDIFIYTTAYAKTHREQKIMLQRVNVVQIILQPIMMMTMIALLLCKSTIDRC